MALEIIGAVVIALGILVLYTMVGAKMDNQRFLISAAAAFLLLLIGISALGVSAALFWNKVKALIVLLAGLFMVIKFPFIQSYQKKEFGNTGILLGLTLVILGIYWLLF